MTETNQAFIEKSTQVAQNVSIWPEVLEDDHGPYGYGFRHSPELMALEHIIGEVPPPIVLRDTNQKTPSPRQNPILSTYIGLEIQDVSSAERISLEFFIRLVAHANGMSMPRLESGPTSTDPEHVQERVSDHIARFSKLAINALEVVSSRAYAECVEGDLWHRVRDYPLTWRYKILRLGNSHQRLNQLISSFPLLALKLVMEPKSTGLSEGEVKEALELILLGSPLKSVANILKVSWSIKTLKAEETEAVAVISTKLYEIDDTVRNLAYLYQNEFLNWLNVLNRAQNVSSDYAAWVGREYRHSTGDTSARLRNVDFIGDWVRACHENGQQISDAGLRIFSLNMGWRAALNASQAWHDHLIEVQQVRGLYDQFGFEENFDPREINFDSYAASWPSGMTMDGIEIKRVASYQELLEVARAFRNCATSYVYEMQRGQCSLYTFSEMGQCLALLELRNSYGRYEVGQFLGPLNREPAKTAKVALENWKPKWGRQSATSWEKIYTSPNWVRENF